MVTVRTLSLTFQWIYIFSAFLSFIFFVYQKNKKRCKWEVLYVSSMGGIIAFLKIYLEGDPVNVFTIGENGRKMPWLRYVGWLITCPVLLIHLGNLTGEANFNIMRLMKMLVGLQLMVVSASTATVLDSGVRWFFYFTGWCSMLLVFSQAFDVFFEAQNIFPAKAKKHVSLMAITFFTSWCMFAIAWFLSPHGIGATSTDFTNFLMAVADVPSKTIWGILGWQLRWNILRKANGELNEKTAKALEAEIKAKVCIVDNDMAMAHYLLGKLTSMQYEPIIAKDPEEMYTIIENGEADVIFMEHSIAEAGDYNMSHTIFYNYRLPVVAYGYDIPVNTFFLRSKHINDYIHGLPQDVDIEAVMERWAPLPGMEEEAYAPARKPVQKQGIAAPAAAADDAPKMIRTPSFTEKAQMIFGAAKNPHAEEDHAPAPAPAPPAPRSPRGGASGRMSPHGTGNVSPRGSMRGGMTVIQPRGSIGEFNGLPRGGSTDGMFNSMASDRSAGAGGEGFNSTSARHSNNFATSAQQQQQQQQPPAVEPREVHVGINPAPPVPAQEGERSNPADLQKLQSKLQDVEMQLKHLRALSTTQNRSGGEQQ